MGMKPTYNELEIILSETQNDLSKTRAALFETQKELSKT